MTRRPDVREAFAPQADGRVWVGAGLRLKNLCGLAAKAGLQGFEFMEGIPATIGGALRMNAGAMGGWTFDIVDEVHLLTLAGEKRVMKKAEKFMACGTAELTCRRRQARSRPVSRRRRARLYPCGWR